MSARDQPTAGAVWTGRRGPTTVNGRGFAANG